MPVQPMQFPLIDFEGANPVLAGAQRGATLGNTISDYLTKSLQQERMKKELPFVTPMAEQALRKSQLFNDWYGHEKKSEIGLRGSQSNLANAEANIKKYLLGHAGYLGGDTTKTLQLLKDMGLLNPGSPQQQPNAQPGMQQGIPPAMNGSPMQPGMQQPTQPPQQMGGGSGVGYGSPAAPYKTGNPLVDAILNKGYASPALKQKQFEGWEWSHIPVDAKRGMIAQGVALGLEPTELIKEINNGKTIEQIAQEKGFDPGNLPNPRYFPTTGNIQQNITANQSEAELEVMGKLSEAAIAPYADTYGGYSPKALMDSVTGSNSKALGKYIGALTLQSEIAMLRNKTAGGVPGITAVHDLKNAALAGLKANYPRLTKEAFEEAQEFINKGVKQGLKARNAVGMSPFGSSGDEESSSKSGVIKYVRDKSGKIVKAQ